MLPQTSLENLSSNQYYSYRICWAVILEEVDDDLQLLEGGKLCHSGWLIVACQILRRYVFVCNRSESLQIMAQLCIKVYFSSRFDKNKNATISDIFDNYFNMMRRIATFLHQTIETTRLNTMQ